MLQDSHNLSKGMKTVLVQLSGSNPRQVLLKAWNLSGTEWARRYFIEDLDNTRSYLRALQEAQGDLDVVSRALSELCSSGMGSEYMTLQLMSSAQMRRCMCI